MCKAKEFLRCPNCRTRLEVTRPDSLHPLCSLEKPRDDEVEDDVVTQVYSCKNTWLQFQYPGLLVRNKDALGKRIIFLETGKLVNSVMEVL